MRLQQFMLLNILGSIIELSFVLLVSYLIGGEILMNIVLVLYVGLFIYQLIRTNNKNIFKESKPKNDLFEKHMYLIDETSKLKNKKLYYKYVDLEELPNPAFYFKNTVYINTRAKVDDLLFEGMLAHELGHATTKLGDVINLVVFRFSTIFSNLLYMVRFSIKDKKTWWFKLLDYMFFVIYMILNTIDIIILHPFIKEDEYIANDYAFKTTGGNALRVYYYGTLRNMSLMKVKYDLKHPPVKKMLERLEKQMDLKEDEKYVYAVGSKVYFTNTKDSDLKHIELVHNYYLNILEHDKEVSYKLARNFEQGRGTNKDIDEALKFYIKTFDLGNIQTAIKIAEIYKSKDDLKEAFNYYIKASELNMRVANYELGLMYEEGIHVELDIDKAIEYYQKGSNLREKRCINKLKELVSEEEIKEEI